MGNKLSVKRLKFKKSKREQVATAERPAQDGLHVPQVVITSTTMDRLPSPTTNDSPNPSKLELYTRGYCPFTEQIRTALTYKGIDFALLQVEGTPAWFKAASPEETVPVLRLLDGTYKNNSAEILEWIEKEYPKPELTKDEEWVEFIRNDMIPSFSKVMMGTKPAIQKEFRPKLKAAVTKLIEQLQKDRDGPYLLGKYSLADALLTPFLRRLILIEYFRAFTISDPNLDRYIQTLEATEPYSNIAVPISEIKAYLKAKIPKMPPMSAGRLQHKSIRSHFSKSIALAEQISTDELGDQRAFELSKQLYKRVKTLILFIEEHASFEESVIYPIFEEMTPGSTKRAHSEHDHEGPALSDFKAELDRILLEVEASGEKEVTAREQARRLQVKLKEMAKTMDEHMEGEETDLFPMTAQLGEREPEVFRKVYYHCCHVRELLLPFVLEPLNGPERMQYMYNIDSTIREHDPQEWKKCQEYLHKYLPQHEWEELVDRLPSLAMV